MSVPDPATTDWVPLWNVAPGGGLPDPTGQDGKWLTVSGGAMLWNTLPAGTVPDRLGTVAKTTADWNNEIENGWYMADGATNAPTTGWYIGLVTAHNNLWVTQEVWQFASSTSAPALRYWRRSSDVSSTRTWGPWISTDAPPIVTALPGSAVNGDRVIFTNSLSAPTYQWLLQFDSSLSSNKWRFIGGPPVKEHNAVSANTNGYFNVPTPLVVALTGSYLLRAGCFASNSAYGPDPKLTASGADVLTVTYGPNAARVLEYNNSYTANASDTVSLQVRANGSDTTFAHGWIELIPRRVGG
jgi:hypothetical protein